MTILLKAIYRFNKIPINLSMALFTELEQQQQKKSQFVWKHKDPEQPKQSWGKKMELKESAFLTSDYTKKLQSVQYGTGTKTEIQINGKREKAQR